MPACLAEKILFFYVWDVLYTEPPAHFLLTFGNMLTSNETHILKSILYLRQKLQIVQIILLYFIDKYNVTEKQI